MKLLVVLSAVVVTALARPGYLGAAGIAGLLGNSIGIGIGAPAYTPAGLGAAGVIGAGRATYLGSAGNALGAGGVPLGGVANIQIGPDGVPVDTPEVAAAKAGHAAAVAETQARDAAQAAADAAVGVYDGTAAGVGAVLGAGIGAGVGAGVGAGYRAPGAGLARYGPANIVIGPDGVPQDTPEVSAAKVAHADAVAQAQARDAAQASADAAFGAAAAGYAGVGYAGAGLAAAAVSAPSQGLARYGPANIQIGPGGVPLDTPEVAAGKVAAAVAHLHAKARLGLIAG